MIDNERLTASQRLQSRVQRTGSLTSGGFALYHSIEFVSDPNVSSLVNGYIATCVALGWAAWDAYSRECVALQQEDIAALREPVQPTSSSDLE